MSKLRYTTKLNEHLGDVVNTPVKKDGEIVGNIINYDQSTGMTTIEIDESFTEKVWAPIAGHHIGISSRRS